LGYWLQALSLFRVGGRGIDRTNTIESGLLELIGEFEESSRQVRISGAGKPTAIGRLLAKSQPLH
jgi:hypothetical protein